MDISSLLNFLPTLLQLFDAATAIRTTIRTGGDVDTIVHKLIPQVQPVLQAIGQQLFPKVTQDLAHLAAIDVFMDHEGTMWVQNGLNALGASPKLTVDGIYGNGTRKAVEVYQAAHNLKVDGWSGPKTSASIALETAKLAK